jgi:hypothetical protein
MEYKQTDDPEYPHSFTFTDWEAETLQAAYAESNVISEQLGNSGRGEGFESYIILTPERKKCLHLKLTRLAQITRVLEEFIERTDDEAGEISRLPLPRFGNIYVAQRRRFGEWAEDLAVEIRKIESGEGLTLSEEEIQDFSEQLDEGIPES